MDCYLLSYNFELNRVGTSEDIAIFGLWMDGDGAEFGDAELAHLAAGGEIAWREHMTPDFWASNVTLSSVTATSFLANGNVLAQQQSVPETPWVGTNSTAALPWETALAVSLYTYPRGTFVSHAGRKRGRIYLPPMASAMLDSSNSGYLDNGAISSVLADMHVFLGLAGNSDEGVPVGQLSVFSRTDSVLRHVSQLSLDAKFDSQRRRENRETAGYITTSFP